MILNICRSIILFYSCQRNGFLFFKTIIHSWFLSACSCMNLHTLSLSYNKHIPFVFLFIIYYQTFNKILLYDFRFDRGQENNVIFSRNPSFHFFFDSLASLIIYIFIRVAAFDRAWAVDSISKFQFQRRWNSVMKIICK